MRQTKDLTEFYPFIDTAEMLVREMDRPSTFLSFLAEANACIREFEPSKQAGYLIDDLISLVGSWQEFVGEKNLIDVIAKELKRIYDADGFDGFNDKLNGIFAAFGNASTKTKTLPHALLNGLDGLSVLASVSMAFRNHSEAEHLQVA